MTDVISAERVADRSEAEWGDLLSTKSGHIVERRSLHYAELRSALVETTGY